MLLASGTRLGAYELLSLLGSGGMGEVYRARDTRLHRDVALKVLPAGLGDSPERRTRFEQEARAAGALSHPNIVSVYDIGQEDGMSYIVSELVEGDSLREQIGRGPIPVRRCLDIATQLAEGLAAAHAAGIVHRDLKPENVLVNREGRVKILDFGLAKYTHPKVVDSTATVTMSPTHPGMVMGTVGYMSPEQVRGEAVDHRSDIFNLGLLVYELLSGQRAFRGPSSVEVMNAILKEEPPEIQPPLPPALERILRRCLEKEPDRRFQSAADLAFALLVSSGAAVAVAASGRDGRAVRGTVLRWAGLMLVAGSVVAGAYWLGMRRTAAPPAPQYRRVLTHPSELYARFSSDAKRILYADSFANTAATKAYDLSLTSGEKREVPLPPGAGFWAVSSKDELVGFSDGEDGKTLLTRIALSGGPPRQMMEGVRAADWSPDGTQLAIIRRIGLRSRLEYPIGVALYETEGGGPAAMLQCRVSRSGDKVAFLSGQRGELSLYVVGPSRPVKALWKTRGRVVARLSWSPDDREIWLGQPPGEAGDRANIIAVDLNGTMRPLANLPAGELLDVGSDGTALISVTQRWSVLKVQVGSAAPFELASEFGMLHDLASDGGAVVYGSPNEVQYQATNGAAPVRLSDASAGPLSPDGKWVLSARGGERPAEYRLVPTGPGEERALRLEGINAAEIRGPRWLADSEHVSFVCFAEDQPHDICIGNIKTGAVKRIQLGASRLVPQSLHPSPDGKRFCGRTPDQGWAVYSADGKAKPVAGIRSDDRDAVLGWTSDGAALWATEGCFGMPRCTVYRLDPQAGSRKPWREIDAGSGRITNLVITPDGRAIAFGVAYSASTLYTAAGLK